MLSRGDEMTDTFPIAFIGGGNMAWAMLDGLRKGGFAVDQMRVSEPEERQRQSIATVFGIQVMQDNTAAVQGARVVVLAVKPGVVKKVLQEIAPHLEPHTLVLSIAAGITLKILREPLSPTQPVVRAMPNTPALIGEGITVYLPSPEMGEEDLNLARRVLTAMGEVCLIRDESLLDGVTALSGSGPAYVYLMIEALSDGGVACGLPRDLADRLAVQTLVGSAKLVRETKQHPAALKNQVTSPGGTTIAGLMEMEKHGVRGALMATVQAAWKRSRELGGG